jgi:sugar phosphate isomerase/epimerase
MKVIMHSYTFRTYPLERALKKAAEFGWDGIELSTVHFNVAKMEEELGRVIELASRYGVDIHVIDVPGNFIVDDEAKRRESIEFVKRVIPVVRNYGIQVINGGVGSLVGPDPRDYGKNGSALANDAHYERAAEALREVGRVAESEGVAITLEIHMNTLHDTAKSTLRLLEMVNSPAVKANPDPGNMYSTPQAEKGFAPVDILKGKIGHFHFKNCYLHGGAYSYSALLEDGDIDNFKIVERLKETEYNGAATIEYCGQGDPNVAARLDLAYMRSILSELAY